MQIIEAAMRDRVTIFPFVPHSTHLVQPLHVGSMSPKTHVLRPEAWARSNTTWNGLRRVDNMNKDEFLKVLVMQGWASRARWLFLPDYRARSN